jgi:hypothetical protein
MDNVHENWPRFGPTLADLRWIRGAYYGCGIAQAEHPLTVSTVSNDQRNVVVLLAGAELLKFINDRSHQSFCWKMAMPLQRLHQALLSEFLPARAAAFGDTIGVKRERVSWAQHPLRHRAIKFLE